MGMGGLLVGVRWVWNGIRGLGHWGIGMVPAGWMPGHSIQTTHQKGVMGTGTAGIIVFLGNRYRSTKLAAEWGWKRDAREGFLWVSGVA